MIKDQEYLEKKHLIVRFSKKTRSNRLKCNVSNSISETVNFRNKKLDESNRSDNLGIDIQLI